MLDHFRKDPLLYLAGAAVIATSLSIAAFEILMGAALVALIVDRARLRVPPVWIPLALFMFGTIVSLAASGHAREGLPQVKKFYIYLMLFLVVSAFRSIRQIRWVALGWSLAAAASAVWGMQQFFRKYEKARETHQAFYNYYVANRITGFADHWMTLGGELMIALLVIAAIVCLGTDRRWTLWLLALAVPVSIALEETWTRSTWLGGVCGGLYLIWFWRRWAVLAVPALIAVLLLINPFDIRERAMSAFSPHGKTDSNAHREELRDIGWKMIEAHPWLGVGPEQVSKQYQNYLPAGMQHPKQGEYYGHLENDYIQYAAERGVPTMLALMWVIGQALFDFARALRTLPKGAEVRWILHAAIAVTIAMLVSGFYSWNLNGSALLAMYLAVLGCGYAAILPSSNSSASPAEPARS